MALPDTRLFFFVGSSNKIFLTREKFRYSSSSFFEILHVDWNSSPTLSSENFFILSYFVNTKDDFSRFWRIIGHKKVQCLKYSLITWLSQIYGNLLIYIGSDGDAEWDNRSTRFVKPLNVDEVLKIKFTISAKEEIDDEYGKIAVDYEGKKQNDDLVVVSKKNWYRIKKEPPRNQ